MPRNNLYWHFVRLHSDAKPRLRYGDGREVKVGEMIEVKHGKAHPEGWDIAPCSHGLHASLHVDEAANYASHHNQYVLCRVKLSGKVLHQQRHENKAVASRRTVVAMLDRQATSKVLADFLRPYLLEHLDEAWPGAPEEIRQFLTTGGSQWRFLAQPQAQKQRADKLCFDTTNYYYAKAICCLLDESIIDVADFDDALSYYREYRIRKMQAQYPKKEIYSDFFIRKREALAKTMRRDLDQRCLEAIGETNDRRETDHPHPEAAQAS